MTQRILIVDDEADIGLILKLQLEDAGFATMRARDGVEALDTLRRERFDLLLLDMKMPVMDGMQVLERVRQDHTELPVIMMTAHGSENIAVEAMKQGASDYIAKPFEADHLLKSVKQVLQLRRTQEENLRLQREIEEERKKNEAILEGMADLMVAVDPGGKVIAANRRVEEVLEKSRDQILGTPVTELVTGPPSAELPCLQVIATGAPSLDVAYSLHTPKGSIPVLSSATPLISSEGKLVGSVEIIRDISRLRALEQEKEDFVSMLSHDLKSPITAVVGSIDLVREGRLGKINSEQKEYLESAIESCHEMVEMIDNLLDIHRFEAGRMSLAFQQEDPLLLIQRSVGRMKPLARKSDLEIMTDFSDPVPPVRLDRNKFVRLLNNLLSNAIRFTPEGGTVTVAGGMVTGAQVTVPPSLYTALPAPSQQFFRLAVKDTGVGIPQESLSVIFDRFVQARNRRRGHSGGTGLGLNFCRKVMDAHNGYIWAESREGAGTTLMVLFPVEENVA